jgi:hypothetical protein
MIIVTIYEKREIVRYLNILTYFLYGIRITEETIMIVIIILNICDGIGGIKRLNEAAMALISAPEFIVFAINSKKIMGITILLEYFFFMTADKPFPVKRPILGHIS